MESKAKFLGHSIRQMLIVFPIGLLATAVAFWLIVSGLIGGAAAESGSMTARM